MIVTYIFKWQFLCSSRHHKMQKKCTSPRDKNKRGTIFHSLWCLLFILLCTANGLYYLSYDDSMVVVLADDYEYACSFISYFSFSFPLAVKVSVENLSFGLPPFPFYLLLLYQVFLLPSSLQYFQYRHLHLHLFSLFIAVCPSSAPPFLATFPVVL